MHPNMHCQLCALLLLTIIAVIGYVLTDYDEETPPQNALLVKAEDYLGLDGELSILPLWCSTCALIGTSGHLLKHAYGSEIDENHTCIFRLGFSPIRGMERFVGARTSVRVVDSVSFFPFLKRPWKLMGGSFNSEAWILLGRRPGDITWFHRPMLSSVVKKDDTKFLWMTKSAEVEVYSELKKHVRDMERHMDVGEPSFYWENKSQPVCRNGMDASFTLKKSASFVANIPTIPERRAMVDWISHHIGRVTFYAPTWPV